MATVIVTACSTFGLTVSQSNAEIMYLKTKDGGNVSFTINAAAQVYHRRLTPDFTFYNFLVEA